MGKVGKKNRPLEGVEIEGPASKENAETLITSRRYGIAISLLLITIMALLVYSNTLSTPFLFDDIRNIVDTTAGTESHSLDRIESNLTWNSSLSGRIQRAGLPSLRGRET